MGQYKTLVEEFNYFVGRFNNAERWFNANTEKVTEKHIQELQYIIREASLRQTMIETYRGYKLTQEESLEGIKKFEI